jgi:hypothetical protein
VREVLLDQNSHPTGGADFTIDLGAAASVGVNHCFIVLGV